MSVAGESSRVSFRAYATSRPSSRFYADIISSAVQEAVTSHKVTAVCFPSLPIVQHAFQAYISKYKNDNVSCDITSNTSNYSCYLVSYVCAISDNCLNLCESFYLVDGHLLATYDHVCIINRIFAEVSLNNKMLHFFADPMVSFDEGTVLNNYCERYKVSSPVVLQTDLPLPRVIPMQCELGNGVEFMSESLPFYKALRKSRCPLTDALISTVAGCIAAKLRCLVLCSSDSEAKEVAQRLGTSIGSTIPTDNLPSLRIAMTSGFEINNSIVIPTESPFSKTLSGFATRIKEFPVAIIVGEKQKLLYSGITAPVVINIIYSGNRKPFVEAEFVALHNLASSRNSFIATISDQISMCYTSFVLSMRVFNKVVINVVIEGKADKITDVQQYFNHFFVPDVDAIKAIEELDANGSLIKNGDSIEVLQCRYLSGFFAVEKRKFLNKAFKNFDFSDTLFMFFLANVYFVEPRDISTVFKAGQHTIFGDPEVKVLCDEIGLHDPRVSSAHFMKLESAVIISTLVHWYCLNDRPNTVTMLLCGREWINEFVKLTLKNLRKTADITRDFFSCNFAAVFKNLETMCFQFHTSSLRPIIGLDMTTVNSLTLAGIKSIQHFIQSSSLGKHLRCLASRKNVAPKAMAAELRRNAQLHTMRNSDLNLSGNTSVDLFSNSLNNDEVTIFNYCALKSGLLDENFLPVTPSDTVFIHVSSTDDVSVICISDTINVFQFQLFCCGSCEQIFLFRRVLQACQVTSQLYFFDVLQMAKFCTKKQMNLSAPLQGYCLKTICYITRLGGPAPFLQDDVKPEVVEAWPTFYRIVMKNGVFSTEAVHLLANFTSTIQKLVLHDVARTVRAGINVLATAGITQIPFQGFDKLLASYRKKLTTFPDDVIKAAKCTFIPENLHYALADNVGLLVKTKKDGKTKLVSNDAATNNQSNPFYTQLSQIRKLLQAIESLDEQIFRYHSGYFFPDYTYGDHGRLYTSAPNLQNFAKTLPFKDLPSPRSLISVMNKDDEMWSADFSEIEFRMAAVLSKDTNLLAAIRSPDVFAFVSEKLGLTNASRADVKLFFYGMLYGMGSKTLEETYGFSKLDAQILCKKFETVFNHLCTYRTYLKDCVHRGQLITNYFGMPVIVDASTAYAAINGVIQSSASYILLAALSKFDLSLPIKVQFTVHDEVIFIASKSIRDDVVKLVPNWMEMTLEDIHFPVKLAVGPQWDSLVRL